MPDIGPSGEKTAAARAYIQKGLPFLVDMDPLGSIFDSPVEGGELTRLKTKFLLPLASSPHAAKIRKVSIDDTSLEWYQWTCKIEIEDLSPITITHFAGLYDGASNTDPDAYKSSRKYVLQELERMAKHVWAKPAR